MTCGILIFARADSKRLPGKVHMDLRGRPLLGHVIDRTRRVRQALPIVIATSTRPVDDSISAFAEAEGVPVFRGSFDDVARRAADAASHYGFDSFVRVCGDRPFCDPSLIEDLLALFEAETADLATNACVPTYPKGLMTEIVRTAALTRILELTDDPADREHVTRYFYRYPSLFRIVERRSGDTSLTELNLALDTAEDVERTVWIIDRLAGDPTAADITTVIALARSWQVERETHRRAHGDLI